jgi:hypothetical protein
MTPSCENVHRAVADDDTLLTQRQRFVCMFFEDVYHIRRTAANLAASGDEVGLSDDIVSKLKTIIGISDEISRKASEKMIEDIPRSNTDLSDWT